LYNTLFSCSRYLRSSGAWLALSASDFFRSAKCAASSPFALLLRLAAATALISVASCRTGLDVANFSALKFELVEFLFEFLNRNTPTLLLF
jgi:hypothetical protein